MIEAGRIRMMDMVTASTRKAAMRKRVVCEISIPVKLFLPYIVKGTAKSYE
jgi:hypothetical protein